MAQPSVTTSDPVIPMATTSGRQFTPLVMRSTGFSKIKVKVSAEVGPLTQAVHAEPSAAKKTSAGSNCARSPTPIHDQNHVPLQEAAQINFPRERSDENPPSSEIVSLLIKSAAQDLRKYCVNSQSGFLIIKLFFLLNIPQKSNRRSGSEGGAGEGEQSAP